MNIDITEATADDRAGLANLLELYMYDFSEFSGADAGDDGRFVHSTAMLDRYLAADATGRHAFVARVDGKLAGFAFVHRGSALDGGPDAWDIAEFFVMRKYRRRGAGEAVARHIWGRFPGRWQVREMRVNVPAHRFWRAIIGRYTNGRFEEREWDDERWRGPVQFFATP